MEVIVFSILSRRRSCWQWCNSLCGRRRLGARQPLHDPFRRRNDNGFDLLGFRVVNEHGGDLCALA